MTSLFRRLWNDDRGAVLSTELVLILGILVFGIIPGLVALRNSLIAAMGTIGNAITTIVPSFTYSGFAIGRLTGGGTIAQIPGYQLDPNTFNRLSGNQIAPLATAINTIPPAP